MFALSAVRIEPWYFHDNLPLFLKVPDENIEQILPLLKKLPVAYLGPSREILADALMIEYTQLDNFEKDQAVALAMTSVNLAPWRSWDNWQKQSKIFNQCLVSTNSPEFQDCLDAWLLLRTIYRDQGLSIDYSLEKDLAQKTVEYGTWLITQKDNRAIKYYQIADSINSSVLESTKSWIDNPSNSKEEALYYVSVFSQLKESGIVFKKNLHHDFFLRFLSIDLDVTTKQRQTLVELLLGTGLVDSTETEKISTLLWKKYLEYAGRSEWDEAAITLQTLALLKANNYWLPPHLADVYLLAGNAQAAEATLIDCIRDQSTNLDCQQKSKKSVDQESLLKSYSNTKQRLLLSL
jgi:hypothetical protein